MSLIEQFNKLKKDQQKWQFVMDNKDKLRLMLDNDDTLVFDDDSDDVGRFGDYIGNSFGVMALLGLLKIKFDMA